MWYFNSTTIRAALVAILPTLLLIFKALGVEVATEEADRVIDAIAALAGALSIVFVIIGRVKAQRKIEEK